MNKAKYVFIIAASFCFLSSFSCFSHAAIEYQVNQIRNGKQASPSVATNKVNCLVVWEDNFRGRRDVYMRLTDTAGRPIGNAVNLTSANVDVGAYSPDVASDGTNYLVVWAQAYPDKGIKGVIVDSKGSPGPIFVIENSVFMLNPDEVKVASSGQNYFVVYNRAYHFKDIFGKIVDRSGRILSSVTVSDDPGFAEDISVASNTVSYLVAWRNYEAGYSYARGYSISARWFNLSTGAALTGRTEISRVYEPDSGIELGGTACVGAYYYYIAWHKHDEENDNSVIEARTVDQSGGVVTFQTNVHQVSTNNGSEIEQYPEVTADQQYKIYVVWQGRDRHRGGISCQKMLLSGAKEGREFVVNKITAKNQSSPDIAVVANTKSVCVWQSNAGTSGYDIKDIQIMK